MNQKSIFVAVFLVKLIDHIYATCPDMDPPAVCFTQSEFDDAVSDARNQLETMESLLQLNYNYPGFTLTEDDPAFGHFSTVDLSEFTLENHHIATSVNNALQALKSRHNLTKSQLKSCLVSENISTSAFCVPRQPTCEPTQISYYQLSGQCNNIQHPLYAAKDSPLIRLLENGYKDGIAFKAGDRSSSARSDSEAANKAKGFDNSLFPGVNNQMMITIGQMLTHEFLRSQKSQLGLVGGLPGFNCCNPKNDTFLAYLIASNEYCLPIDVASNDPCYANQVWCLNYFKSLKALNNCKLDETAMTINLNTPVMDAELLYNYLSLAHLAENNGKFNLNNFTQIVDVLIGYDDRSMQVPGLFLYLNFFAELHNIIFDELKKVYGSLSNERLSFEARKFTVAVYQKIFIDFLSDILHEPESSMLANLGSCYDPSINPQVSLEYNIVLRLLHTFIKDTISTYDENNFSSAHPVKGKTPIEHNIGITLDNLTWYENNKCGLTHGSLDTSWNQGGLGPNMHCKFFAAQLDSIGHDLHSMDYETGRETGESSYTEVLRKIYGIDKCDNEMTKTDFIKHDEATQDFLAQRYNNIMSDVSFTFGVDFEGTEGKPISPTISFVLAEQIKRSVCGDRFWYENAEFFREDQKARIRYMDFFFLLCLVDHCNSARVQTNPFKTAGYSNMKYNCPPVEEILSFLDLANWI